MILIQIIYASKRSSLDQIIANRITAHKMMGIMNLQLDFIPGTDIISIQCLRAMPFAAAQTQQ